MSDEMARSLADALGGEAILSGEDFEGESSWSVRIERKDGRLVVITESSVDEFYDREAETEGHCYLSISLV